MDDDGGSDSTDTAALHNSTVIPITGIACTYRIVKDRLCFLRL